MTQITCHTCAGEGYFPLPEAEEYPEKVECLTCHGTGKVWKGEHNKNR